MKQSREHRNALLVAHLNQQLRSATYFESKTQHAAFTTLETDKVELALGGCVVAFAVLTQQIATWASVHAGLAEPASLGRPHFRKYLLSIGVREPLIFGPRTGDGRGVVRELFYREMQTD